MQHLKLAVGYVLGSHNHSYECHVVMLCEAKVVRDDVHNG